ncbi:transmembrane protease serine 9 [Bombus vancouverensis nearcticus]|uniref:transmembrane protease serine 9 n=1 Tax=Bombus vancouverensis nearcticus TaxID=2705178 RepID=UPI00402B5093
MKFSQCVVLLVALYLASETCQASTFGERVKNFFGIFGNKPPYAMEEPAPCYCSCGLRNEESRIVGGQTTRMNEFPWMARLSYLNKFYCGGTLINDRYVLTAAHCVKGFMWFMIKVTFGEHDRCTERGAETRYVVRVLTGDFSFLNFDNDIALLRLNERVPLSDTIRPICLPTEKDKQYVGTKAIASGWGTLYEDGKPSCLLQEVEVPVMSLQDCRNTSYSPRMISDNMMCAGYPDGKKDSCQGDSGGPLIAEREDKKYELIGIVSWGNGCARPGYPGVYTRVTRYINWIVYHSREGCFCEQKQTNRLTGTSIVSTAERKVMKLQNFLKYILCGLLLVLTSRFIHCNKFNSSDIGDDELRQTRGVLDYLLGRFKTCGNCLCGRPNRFVETRFLGGEYTKTHEFPWLANIHVKSKLLLSGVLINDRYVLSSASQLIRVTAPEVKISFGEYDRCNLDVSSTTVSVESLVLYPEYNVESHAHNLALMKLSQPIKFERRISPICLPNPGSTYLGQVGTLVGWIVSTEEDTNNNQTCRPRKLGLPILGRDECIRSGINLTNFHNDSGCAGILGGSSIVCENDVGSSVQYRSYAGVYDLVGIISDVNKCGSAPAISIFTRVGPHLNWILQQTKDACYCPK